MTLKEFLGIINMQVRYRVSDLWQANGTAETSEEIKNHMFILEFKKQ